MRGRSEVDEGRKDVFFRSVLRAVRRSMTIDSEKPSRNGNGRSA